jgi:cupin superfamily acireductone dioxygenase involved in methionine salvage
MLPNDNIPDPMMRSIFKSTNIKLMNDEYYTNITYLHKQANKCKINQTNVLNIEQIIKTSGLIDYDIINTN